MIIDSKNRVTPAHRLVSLPGKTLLARANADTQAWPEDVQQLEVVTEATGQLDLVALMETLAAQDINHVWVEAGAGLAGGLLKAGLVDELIVYQAPKLMGSDSVG
ncbi:diaminohydroxyphosphoribosylaminopyrimidine deaminase [Photobacterium aphoticum]|uniref:Diaminohydroxyphosphoribosylaminopyrimidine deaminase n=1 Tax=Photobacterium aphoticum TaxID=754436 RepID=A0A090QY07_9GAMM|nr:diaminohydroxyphosphoribosylaminopyrimidine deaminase [Photobacterium aphoticum]